MESVSTSSIFFAEWGYAAIVLVLVAWAHLFAFPPRANHEGLASELLGRLLMYGVYVAFLVAIGRTILLTVGTIKLVLTCGTIFAIMVTVATTVVVPKFYKKKSSRSGDAAKDAKKTKTVKAE